MNFRQFEFWRRVVTLGFTLILLAPIVLFVRVIRCALYNKSLFHFKVSFTGGGFDGSIIFGTLGYCVEWANRTTSCSKPSFGYGLCQFSPFHPPLFMTGLNFLSDDSDINGLVKISHSTIQFLVFCHISALILATFSVIFGLLAAYRRSNSELKPMSMLSCNNCLGASIILSIISTMFSFIALIFDLIFTATKIESNNSAQKFEGVAMESTLAAFGLLIFMIAATLIILKIIIDIRKEGKRNGMILMTNRGSGSRE